MGGEKQYKKEKKYLDIFIYICLYIYKGGSNFHTQKKHNLEKKLL